MKIPGINYEDVHLSNDADKISRLLMQFAHENPGHRWISLTSYGKKEMGYLVPLDEGIPFVVKRIFYLTDIPNGGHRGRHAYYETKQVLICVSGEVKVKCQEGEREVTQIFLTGDIVGVMPIMKQNRY